MRWCLGWLSCLCIFQAKAILQLQKTLDNDYLALVGNNKKILYAAFGAPGSTHNAGMLKST